MRSAGISSGSVLRRVSAAALGLVAASAVARATERPDEVPGALADVRALAAPGLEGRGVLTSGLGEASRYLAARFSAAGLTPAGEAGTFFQAVDIPLPRRPAPDTALALGGEALALGVDFAPNIGAAATRAAGPIAFAGRCALADLAALEVRGKLILCLEGGPTLAHKLDNVVARGAVALLLVDGSPGAETVPLPTLGQAGASAIASFRVRAAAVDRLLAPGGRTVAGLREAVEANDRSFATSRLAASFELPAWGAFRVGWVVPAIRGRNVVGLIAGADPSLRGEAVLVGAHYDHVGQGDEGGSLDGPGLHPGADDNASGIAALLEAAAELARAPTRPRRSILFVAFTGEEKGLVGSIAAAAHAPRTVVAMLNFDMVGRMKAGRLEVQGASTSPGWRELVERANVEHLALSFPPRVTRNSDHAPFVAGNVPALLLHTGLHGDYHRRSDTPDKINADGIDKAARLAARVARLLADRPERLAFTGPIWTSTRAGAGVGP